MPLWVRWGALQTPWYGVQGERKPLRDPQYAEIEEVLTLGERDLKANWQRYRAAHEQEMEL